jgi:protein-disulfide isomerase
VAKSRRPATTRPATTAGPNRSYLIAGGIALVLVVIAASMMMRTGGSAATAPVAISMDPAEIQRARGVAMGEDDAPVLIYEFADYQCPGCASFATFVHPLIKERLVDRGIVRFVRYDFPLLQNHQHAFLASRAARCAGDGGRYWEYHDVLYGRQPTWRAQRDASSEFIAYAELVGLDRREFQGCLRSDRHAEEVTRNLRLGESLGVGGTPTLMVNGELLRSLDYQDLEAQVLQAAGRTPAEPAS